MGRTWDTLVDEGRRVVNYRNWTLGDLALEVETGYGEGALERYADEIEISYEALKNYRWVADRWQQVNRITDLSWTVHQVFAALDDRHDVVRSQTTWTVAEAREYVERRRRPDFKPSDRRQSRLDRRAPTKCPKCGYCWRIGPGGSVIEA